MSQLPQILYLIAFTVIAGFAVTNLIRSLINIGLESQKTTSSLNSGKSKSSLSPNQISHPELLDEQGKPVNEPLLVMRSVNVDDERQKLNALYNDSPGNNQEEDKGKD